jgi:hypothetical protein
VAAIKLQAFTGLIPRLSDRLLPDNAASFARNTKLLSGELRGFRALVEYADFSSESFTVERAFRVPYTEYGDTLDAWLLFSSRDVDVVRSPLLNDTYNRYYWAGDGRPQYSTQHRIITEMTPHYLGIPTPVTAPTVTPAAGSNLTRAYVYTFVSEYGEEGPPSPPTTATGNAGTWALTAMDSTVPNAANRNIRKKRIYRTVPGQTSSQFFFVAEVLLTDTAYNDAQTDVTVAANNVLESTSWVEPPVALEGFVAMPNGYLVGWAGRRLVFSEPYRPHAWPAEYELATEFEIVGLAVWGSMLIIGTESQPYIGQGVNPASFSLQKLDAVEPCLSRRGMVATMAGVYYPSINGLVFVNSPIPQIVTQDLLTKEEWADYNPSDIFASQLGLQYIAFNSPTFGFIFNPTEPTARFVELDNFDDVVGIETDRYTGNVQVIREDRIYDWDPETSQTMYWRWKSKLFHLPRPLNFGAFIAQFDDEIQDVGDSVSELYGPYNDERFLEGPLSTLGGSVLGGAAQDPGTVAYWTEPENRMPLGGSPLHPIEFLSLQEPAIRLIVYADEAIIYDRVLPHQKMLRLPSGFKATKWQFEIIGNTAFYSLQVAETGKELAKV